MDYLLDVHTHTIASGHAYNTIMEMAKAGFDKGLKLLGITEHAPMMPGTCHAMYFHNLKVVPRTMCGIELMLGAELNILDYDGQWLTLRRSFHRLFCPRQRKRRKTTRNLWSRRCIH